MQYFWQRNIQSFFVWRMVLLPWVGIMFWRYMVKQWDPSIHQKFDVSSSPLKKHTHRHTHTHTETHIEINIQTQTHTDTKRQTDTQSISAGWLPPICQPTYFGGHQHQMSVLLLVGRCPEVNKFEQGKGVLYSEVQCILGNGHMGPLVDRQTDRQIQLRKFPTHNFFGWR